MYYAQTPWMFITVQAVPPALPETVTKSPTLEVAFVFVKVIWLVTPL